MSSDLSLPLAFHSLLSSFVGALHRPPRPFLNIFHEKNNRNKLKTLAVSTLKKSQKEQTIQLGPDPSNAPFLEELRRIPSHSPPFGTALTLALNHTPILGLAIAQVKALAIALAIALALAIDLALMLASPFFF